MNPLILYDVFTTFTTFIRTWGREYFFLLQKRECWIMHLSIFYIQIDRLTYRFTPNILLYIVMISTNSYSHVLFSKSKIEIVFRRDGRVVDSSGLENRYSSKQRTIEGSNPSLSFCSVNRFFFVLPGFSFSSHKREWLGYPP